MSDGMSDARDYGPSLSKHEPPLLSKNGEPYVPDEKCVRPGCAHPWGDHWDEGPCAMPCPCVGMVRLRDSSEGK